MGAPDTHTFSNMFNKNHEREANARCRWKLLSTVMVLRLVPSRRSPRRFFSLDGRSFEAVRLTRYKKQGTEKPASLSAHWAALGDRSHTWDRKPTLSELSLRPPHTKWTNGFADACNLKGHVTYPRNELKIFERVTCFPGKYFDIQHMLLRKMWLTSQTLQQFIKISFKTMTDVSTLSGIAERYVRSFRKF